MKTIQIVSKKYLFAVGLIVAIVSLKAQSSEIAYRAYVGNSLGLWEQAIKTSPANSFDLALSYHGYLSATMADQDEDAFDKYYDKAVDLLEDLREKEEYAPQSQALLSGVYGLSIAYDSWKGMFLGSKSSSLVKEALAKAPNNPLILKMYASNMFYTPETFGGDPKVGMENCKKAVSLYESKGDTIQNWVYLDALALLGTMHKKAGDLDNSIATYEKALALEPDYGWVKYALLPAAKKASQLK